MKKIRISVLTSLYNCENFLPGYFDALDRIEGKEQIEVLLLHNEPKEDELAVISGRLHAFKFVRHIIIPERETLYRTWNRGIQLSEGEYITVWNVDDVRFPESILQQAEALDTNPDAAIAYGDIWVSGEYGVRGNFKTNSPVFNEATRKDFLSNFQMSCFQMWRKSIHSVIGYYDEQFKCIADFDFQIRAALHFSFVKTGEPLGIYLEDQPHKLSANGLQPFERNIICLRYMDYRHLNLFLLKESNNKYRYNQMFFYDEWIDFTEKRSLGWLYKLKGMVYATFSSLYWLFRQVVKKMVFSFSKSKRC